MNNATTAAPQAGAVISYVPRYDTRTAYGVVMVVHTAQPISGDGEEYIALEVDTDPLRQEWGTTYNGNGPCLDPAAVTVIDLPELAVGQVWACQGHEYRLVSVASRFSANLLRVDGHGNINRFILACPAWQLVRQVAALGGRRQRRSPVRAGPALPFAGGETGPRGQASTGWAGTA